MSVTALLKNSTIFSFRNIECNIKMYNTEPISFLPSVLRKIHEPRDVKKVENDGDHTLKNMIYAAYIVQLG
jgi:hypothetical protein